MSIEIIDPPNLEEALAKLRSFAQEFPDTPYVFRGQQDSNWRLCTSYQRYWMGKPMHHELFPNRMIRQFRSGVKKLGLDHPSGDDPLTWLEYARHHGLPAPLLDFSWSPFVALYFAFDYVRAQKELMHSVVYCLNLDQLAKEMARRTVGVEDPGAFIDSVNAFLDGSAEKLKNGFPMGELLFIRNPSVHTRRMHAQMGTFIYSTIPGMPTRESVRDPSTPSDLEDFLGKIEEGFDSPIVPNEKRPVLTKIRVPHEWISDVFNQLDIMNINGSRMFLSAEGVARDVYNTFNYEPRAAFLREDLDLQDA